MALTSNVTMTVKGDKLTIEVDLSKTFGKSSSGKTTIVASTGGNQELDGHPKMFIGMNVYKTK